MRHIGLECSTHIWLKYQKPRLCCVSKWWFSHGISSRIPLMCSFSTQQPHHQRTKSNSFVKKKTTHCYMLLTLYVLLIPYPTRIVYHHYKRFIKSKDILLVFCSKQQIIAKRKADKKSQLTNFTHTHNNTNGRSVKLLIRFYCSSVTHTYTNHGHTRAFARDS